MIQFTHTFDFCFAVKSEEAAPDMVSPDELRKGIKERLDRISDEELIEACGDVDTVEEEQ